jgi:hypothetical protein
MRNLDKKEGLPFKGAFSGEKLIIGSHGSSFFGIQKRLE